MICEVTDRAAFAPERQASPDGASVVQLPTDQPTQNRSPPRGVAEGQGGRDC